MSMKRVRVEDAAGLPLAHDVTEIRPGEFKGPAFRKGHIVRREDMDHLRRLGKAHLYVLDMGKDELHENDAAKILSNALCGDNVGSLGEPVEGKIKLVALAHGLLRIDVRALLAFNMLGEVMCATRHEYTVVGNGQEVAGTRAIPLVIQRDVVDRAAGIASAAGGIISVKKLMRRRVGLVITGNEVYHGLIEDRFEPIVRRKVGEYGSDVVSAIIVPDETQRISVAIQDMLTEGVDVIITTGGMSVDPDDVTRVGIAQAGATSILYGSPVLPGAMLAIARIGDVPVVGVPACALHCPATVFDLLLPRVLVGETITRSAIAALGHGGLCLDCQECRFPDCAFGKGETCVS